MLTKYPRTYHLPWSLGRTDDDKTLSSVAHFEGREVVVTEKLDGENTTIYADGYTHARSLDSVSHPARTWVKKMAAQVASSGIPDSFRLCGENLFAQHSIGYRRLLSYFYLFGIYDEDTCLSWDATVEWARLLDLQTAPVLYRGLWNEASIRKLWTGKSMVGDEGEGYVVRVADSFRYDEFSEEPRSDRGSLDALGCHPEPPRLRFSGSSSTVMGRG